MTRWVKIPPNKGLLQWLDFLTLLGLSGKQLTGRKCGKKHQKAWFAFQRPIQGLKISKAHIIRWWPVCPPSYEQGHMCILNKPLLSQAGFWSRASGMRFCVCSLEELEGRWGCVGRSLTKIFFFFPLSFPITSMEIKIWFLSIFMMKTTLLGHDNRIEVRFSRSVWEWQPWL